MNSDEKIFNRVKTNILKNVHVLSDKKVAHNVLFIPYNLVEFFF